MIDRLFTEIDFLNVGYEPSNVSVNDYQLYKKNGKVFYVKKVLSGGEYMYRVTDKINKEVKNGQNE